MIDLTIAVPLIVALVEVLKKTGLSNKLAPLTAVLLGITGFYLFSTDDIVIRMFEGLVAGLTASGAYSSAKSILK